MLKVFVRHPDTQEYLRWDGKWSDVSEALNFQDESAAVQWCLMEDLKDYQVIRKDVKKPNVEFILIQQKTPREII